MPTPSSPSKSGRKKAPSKKPAAKKAAGKKSVPADLLRELERLQASQAEAQFYDASDGQRLNMAQVQQKSHAGTLKRYGKDEQQRIRERLALYKKLLAQASHIKRKLNRRVDENGHIGHVLDEHRDQLIEWFARHYDAREVHRHVVQELALDTISYEVVRKWQQRHLEPIRQAQTAARADIGDLPMVHKRVRLEELHDHYFQAKQQHEQTQRPTDREACLRIIEQIRKETDGDLLTINGKIDVEAQVTVTVEQRIQAELMKQLPMQTLVLAKVAAARGVDPAWLMARLTGSYYARFNGFISGAQSANGPSEDFVFPSEQGYDFNIIESQFQQAASTGAQKPTPLSAPLVVTPAQKNQLDDARALLLKRLGLA